MPKTLSNQNAPSPLRAFTHSIPDTPGRRIKIKHLKIFMRVKLLHLVKAHCQNGERMSCSMLLLHRHDKAVHDAVLALRRVLAHVEIGDRPGLGPQGVFNFAQAHLAADKLGEFFRADFAEAF